MASCQRRLGGCVRGAREMSLESPSPPASHGLGPPWSDGWVGVSPCAVVLPQRWPQTSPVTPSRSRSLLGWAGWLALSLSCWAWRSHPTSSSLLPAPGVAGLAGCCAPQGAALPQAPCPEEGGMLSTERREHRFLWEADPWADLLYQRQTEKNTPKPQLIQHLANLMQKGL